MSTLRFGKLLANRGKALIAGAHSYMSPAVSSALKESIIDGALIGAAGGALWGGITSRDGFLEGAGRGAISGAMTGALGGAGWGLYNSPIGSNFKNEIRARSSQMAADRAAKAQAIKDAATAAAEAPALTEAELIQESIANAHAAAERVRRAQANKRVPFE
jgi:hypothetical protein